MDDKLVGFVLRRKEQKQKIQHILYNLDVIVQKFFFSRFDA